MGNKAECTVGQRPFMLHHKEIGELTCYQSFTMESEPSNGGNNQKGISPGPSQPVILMETDTYLLTVSSPQQQLRHYYGNDQYPRYSAGQAFSLMKSSCEDADSQGN